MSEAPKPKKETKVSFSLDLDIFGNQVPLRSGHLNDLLKKEESAATASSPTQPKEMMMLADGGSQKPHKETLKRALRSASFSTPNNFAGLTLTFEDFEAWLAKYDFQLPGICTDILHFAENEVEKIVISQISISLTGTFSVSLEVDFKNLDMKVNNKSFFGIEDVGLAISHSASTTEVANDLPTDGSA